MVVNVSFIGKKLIKHYDSSHGCVSQDDANKHAKGVVQWMGDLLKQNSRKGVPNYWITSDPIKFRAECYQQPNGKVFCIMHVINLSLICCNF